MFKISCEISEVTKEWDTGLLFSIADKHNGVCLFTSLSDKTAGRNILGINPIRRFSDPHEIDEFMTENRSEIDIPVILGYAAYDFKDETEERGLFSGLHENIFPEFYFCLYEYYLVAENSDPKKLKLIKLRMPEIYNKLDPASIFDVPEILLTDGVSKYSGSSLNKAEYEAGVDKIKDYIVKGDIYQANLTRKISGTTELSAAECAVRLKNSNNIEFGVFAKIGNRHIISTSPERLFKLENGIITASPIKGTSPRFSDIEKDSLSLKDLLSSEKNLAELAMIVDLIRNDMNKICSDVTVAGFPLVMKLKNVFHLYSDITGRLNTADFTHILNALFPGGSITGCPKIRSCQIIEELERSGRGPYTGNFGYISLNGNMDFNIMIRTLFYDCGNISFNVGGGITLLSDPEDEYKETIHKAKNIYEALDMEDVWEERYCLTDR
jgi:para-aminobenzoate synthetase component I